MPLEYEDVSFFFTLIPQSVNSSGSQSYGPWALKMIARSKLPSEAFSPKFITKETDKAGREIEVVEGAGLKCQQLRVLSAFFLDSQNKRYIIVADSEEWNANFKSVRSLVTKKWLDPEIVYVFDQVIFPEYNNNQNLTLVIDIELKVDGVWEHLTEEIHFKAKHSTGTESLNPIFDIT